MLCHAEACGCGHPHNRPGYTALAFGYTLVAWVLVLLFPTFWFKLFTDDPAMTASGIGMLRVYFFGFVFMALQFAGQSGFTALGDAKHAISSPCCERSSS